jgi:D-aspartate ligase
VSREDTPSLGLAHVPHLMRRGSLATLIRWLLTCERPVLHKKESGAEAPDADKTTEDADARTWGARRMIAARSARLTGAIGRLLTGYEPLRSPTRADGAAWRARRLPWQPRGTAGSEGLGAVIVGGGFLALGIARSLGRRGIPVCVIDDGPSITRASRYVTTTVRVPDLLEDEQAVSAVLDVGTRLGLQGWVLFPTRDETVAAFARHKARLEEVFRLPLPTYESVRWAWDKRATYELAERLGIPAPRTRSPVDAVELAALDLEFPLVVKPAIKEHFFYATNVKAWRVEDYAELSARFAEAAALVPLGEVMVQELIAGDRLYAYGAFFKDGEALGTMVVRRWRQYPREFGRWSTYVETIDLPLLERQSEEFLRAIDYYGLVELEYKHDARDGLGLPLDRLRGRGRLPGAPLRRCDWAAGGAAPRPDGRDLGAAAG